MVLGPHLSAVALMHRKPAAKALASAGMRCACCWCWCCCIGGGGVEGGVLGGI